MMPRILLTLTLLTIVFEAGLSQSFFLSGTVADERGHPLIGANVMEKGTINGTVTDFEGKFSLVLSDSTAMLLISYTGYKTEEYKLDGKQKAIKLNLKPGDVVLDEVVVTGYAKERRRAAFGKISKAPAYSTPAFAVPSPPSAPPPPPYPSSRDDVAPRFAMEARSAMVMSSTASGTYEYKASSATAGSLTAGEIHDFSKWELWEDIAAEDLMVWREYWKIYPAKRYPLQLTNQDGRPVVNATVTLLDDRGNELWQARTDNTGKAELWDQLFNAQKGPDRNLKIRVDYRGEQYDLSGASSFQQGYNFLSIPVACEVNQAVDIVFVVDATGSMQDEIDYLKAELQDVIKRVQDTLPNADLSLGSVFYRDQGEEYVTRKAPLSGTISRTTDFIAQQEADGGGDNPEAVEEALRVAVEEMNWRADAATKLMFLVLDAPPHQSPEILSTLERITRQAAAQGIRIIPLACSGIDKSTEYLMRSLALATNGTYTFLTNDSGIGLSHIEPTTDNYDVEKLNALLARVIYQTAYSRDCNEKPMVASTTTGDTSVVVAQVELPNDQKEELPKMSLSFYPNPSSGPVNIETNGIGELFLADFSGKILERFTIQENQSTIDIGRYPAGTYHLRFRTEDDQWLGDELVLAR